MVGEELTPEEEENNVIKPIEEEQWYMQLSSSIPVTIHFIFEHLEHEKVISKKSLIKEIKK